jgi:hypothetical protein
MLVTAIVKDVIVKPSDVICTPRRNTPIEAVYHQTSAPR